MYLTQGLHRAVQQSPDAIATVFGDRRRTQRELAERVSRLAGALQEVGVGRGDRVGYLGLNSDWFHEYYMAVPWADAVVTPLNTRWSAGEIAYSLEDAGVGVLFVDDAFVDMVPGLQERYKGLTQLIHVGADARSSKMLEIEDMIACGSPVEDARRAGDELAGLFYTGGTTGFPKGVMLSHGNLVTGAMGSLAGGFISAGATFLHVAPMFHLADLAAWTIVTLTGGTHVMVPRFDPVAAFEAIQRHKVTETVVVPAMLQLLVDSKAIEEYDLTTLRHVGYGGSPITEAVLVRAQARWPQATFCQAFGQTELSPITTLLSREDHGVEGRSAGRLRSAGKAVAHAEIRIVDGDERVLANGSVGEIVARGGHVMQGYWNREQESREALRGGWMHTGDGGYIDDDGYLYVVDRLKDMIITGGENVYSAEVENAVGQHPAVAACAVIGVPDEQWGERVHAVVVLVDGATADSETIREHVKGLIAGYKAPKTFDFVEALPLSSAGKVLKTELRERYWTEQTRSVR